MEGLKMFSALLRGLDGEDKVEAQVVADAFKSVEGHILAGGNPAKSHQLYESALKAAYCLIGRLFLEGKVNHVAEVRRPNAKETKK